MRASGPGQSALLLLDVVAVLNSAQIGYAVIGANGRFRARRCEGKS